MKENSAVPHSQLLAQTYIAIGLPIGMLAAPGQEDPLNQGDPLFWIRYGDKFHGITPLAMLVWLRAMNLATGQEIYEYMLSNNVLEQPDLLAGLINDLLDAGLIIPYIPGQLSGKILSLRVIAQGLGLGINTENPKEFLISHFDGQPVAGLDFASYILWMYFDGLRTFQQAIQDAAVFLQVEQSVLTDHAASLLPVLIKTHSVFLDLALKTAVPSKKPPKKFDYPFLIQP
jgi:hypothetical protein